MHEKHIGCPSCGKTFPLTTKRYRCTCSASLEIIFDYHKLRKLSFEGRPFNQSRYQELYPVKHLATLGEGGTPLLKSKNLAKELPFDLAFKMEGMNPTGSFKDRGSSVEVAKAFECKAKKLVVASTGNMGSSLAAYAARARLPLTVFAPQDAQNVKVTMMLAHKATVYQIDRGYDQAARLAEHYSRKGYHLTGDYLFRREGTKSVGLEIAEQTTADVVFCPVGNGSLMSATWKGFKEMHMLKKIKKKPHMVSVQASGSSTIAGSTLNKGSRPLAQEKPHTIAKAIEVGVPQDGYMVLKAIHESKGFPLDVSDREIIKARNLLAWEEGIFAEPAGAASFAGLLKAKDNIPRGSRVVCVVSGHGLKAPFVKIKGSVRKKHLKR